MRIIAIDPSGNFDEGKGHTGIALIDDNDWNSVQVFSISAKNYETRHEYWTDVLRQLSTLCTDPSTVVIESYVTRMNGFTIGKQSETSMFIGVLVWCLENLGIKYTFQAPSAAKTRFRDELLVRYYPKMRLDDSTGKNRYFYGDTLTSDHVRDAMKHLLYFKKYKEDKLNAK